MAWSVPLLSALVVSGTSNCPTPGHVQAQLEQLSSRAPASAERTATVTRDRESVVVQLREAGELLGEKTFQATSNCAELAIAVAVTLEAWSAEFQAQVPSPVKLGQEPALPVLEPLQATADAERWLRVYLGPAAALPEGVAFGGTLFLQWDVSDWLALGGGVLATSQRRLVLDNEASAQWTRQLAYAAAWYRVAHPAWAVSLGAGAGAGWLSAEGSGFHQNTSSSGVEAALVSQLVGEYRWGAGNVWAGSGLAGWLRSQRLESATPLDASGPGGSLQSTRIAQLPALDVWFGLGLGLDFEL